jgi:hypothetical protein
MELCVVDVIRAKPQAAQLFPANNEDNSVVLYLLVGPHHCPAVSWRSLGLLSSARQRKLVPNVTLSLMALGWVLHPSLHLEWELESRDSDLCRHWAWSGAGTRGTFWESALALDWRPQNWSLWLLFSPTLACSVIMDT